MDTYKCYLSSFILIIMMVMASSDKVLEQKQQRKRFPEKLLSLWNEESMKEKFPDGIQHESALNSAFLDYGIELFLSKVASFNQTSSLSSSAIYSYLGRPADVEKSLAIDRKYLARIKERNVTVSDTLFTSNPILSSKAKATGVDVIEVEFADFDQKSWVGPMRDTLGNASHGLLTEFVPAGGLLNNAFPGFVEAVLLNSFHYKGTWQKRLTEVTVASNTINATEYFESTGSFSFLDMETYQAVSLPLNNGYLNMVFVLPRTTMLTFLNDSLPNMVKNHLFPQHWTTKSLVVRLPRVETEITEQYYENLDKNGLGNQTLCPFESFEYSQKSNNDDLFIGPVVQGSSLRITAEYLEIAIATGGSISSVEKLFNPDKRPNPGMDTDGDRKLSENVALNIEDRGIFNPVPEDKSGRHLEENKLSFDRPFFWYLVDQNMGLLSYGSVNSLAYDEDTAKGKFIATGSSAWLHQLVRNQMWICPQIK